MSDTPQMPKTAPVNDRQTSVDSDAYFEDDEFGEYDFTPNSGKGRGGGGGGRGAADQKKAGGRGVYTSKHIRAKEAMRQNQKTSPKKK
jgi:hypothetical protein